LPRRRKEARWAPGCHKLPEKSQRTLRAGRSVGKEGSNCAKPQSEEASLRD
jgi:hypothetical protein